MTIASLSEQADNWEHAADTLRAWALDEDLKEEVMASAPLSAAARLVASRYTAGATAIAALDTVRAGLERGHLGSIEYAGESVRDANLARRETNEILNLVQQIHNAELPSTISFDLSHIGSVISPGLALDHAQQIAAACAETGLRMMISAEGSDRTDLVLDLYTQLSNEYGARVGITLQARLRRTENDLSRALHHPGPIRFVKGAFLEPDHIADRRGSEALTLRYRALLDRALQADHDVAIATHDPELLNAIITQHADRLHRPGIEFEMLLGLGTDALDQLHREGFATREYVIYGDQWWLYVLNRIAEQPHRLITAIADLARARPSGSPANQNP